MMPGEWKIYLVLGLLVASFYGCSFNFFLGSDLAGY